MLDVRSLLKFMSKVEKTLCVKTCTKLTSLKSVIAIALNQYLYLDLLLEFPTTDSGLALSMR